MESTGIIRRIDDLGRIVIPKEIRRTLRIKEGDPFEIFIQDGGVLYKKYNPITSYNEAIGDIIASITDDEDVFNKEVIELLKKASEILKQNNSQ